MIMFSQYTISFTIAYLCGCGWLYGTCFGRFWGLMVDYKAVAMVPFLPLG